MAFMRKACGYTIVQLHQSLVSYLGPVLRLYACQHVPLSTLYVDFEQAHLPA